MRTPLVLVFVAASWALAACNPFHREPVTEVTPDANLNTRWRASLVTPASLGGAVQINGEATMEPSSEAGSTEFKLNIANATAGGIHPWQIHHGRCDADYGLVGPADASRTIKIGDDGRGHASARVAMVTPTTGDYFVTVQASAANPQTIVACGNLAPPAR
jgi:hypothetical protein